MQKIRLHHLQHVPFETLGIIQDWIEENKYTQTATHLYKNEKLPNLDTFDFLIILGGPMSVNDEAKIDWLKAEKEFIKKAIEQDKIVLGICLGAQLIANVLSAKIYNNEQKEIGFFSVFSRSENNFYNQLFQDKNVFHWHGETFDLPEKATLLASSEICKNQAFLYKNNVIGLQFHLEMNQKSIEQIIENCREELVAAAFIQTENEIKQNIVLNIEQNKKMLFNLLDNLKATSTI